MSIPLTPMLQSLASTTPNQRLVARLRAEGWVDCPGVEFPALWQHPIEDLRQWVIDRLQQEGTWMWEADLKLATLIFAIPAHEFQFHPQLKSVLKELELEGVIDLQEWLKPAVRQPKMERVVRLKAVSVA